MLATCVYMVSKMLGVKLSQKEITKHWPSSESGIRTSLQILSEMFKFEKRRLAGYDLDAFTMGVRY